MEKGRIEFDDPTFRPAKKKKGILIPTVNPKWLWDAMKKDSEKRFKWKRIADKDFPKENE